jgi:hypothetical protein
MNIYNYNPVTKLFAGVDHADPDPLTPGNFLIPAHATEIAPPAFDSSTHQAVFDNGIWTVDLLPVMFKAVVSPTNEELWEQFKNSAFFALHKSDITVLRCLEAGTAVPPEWIAYRQALRDIVSADSGDPAAGLPVRPDYPI